MRSHLDTTTVSSLYVCKRPKSGKDKRFSLGSFQQPPHYTHTLLLLLGPQNLGNISLWSCYILRVIRRRQQEPPSPLRRNKCLVQSIKYLVKPIICLAGLLFYFIYSFSFTCVCSIWPNLVNGQPWSNYCSEFFPTYIYRLPLYFFIFLLTCIETFHVVLLTCSHDKWNRCCW